MKFYLAEIPRFISVKKALLGDFEANFLILKWGCATGM